MDQSNLPGPWSAGRVFTLRAGAPTLATPADLATVNPSNILFTWSGVQNGVRYLFQSSLTSDFSQLVESWNTSMTAWSPVAAYNVGTYYWRVSVLDANDNVLSTSGYRTFTASNQAPPQPAVKSTYFPLASPARLLDTRTGNGGTGRLFANTPVTFSVAGRGGVPSNASAVTGNVTVVNSSAGWAVFLGPDPTSAPTTSTINFTAGQVTGNGLTVALSGAGTLSATYISNTGNSTDLVFDVTGYFTPDTSGATYHPMTPARVLDTRSANGWSGKLFANTPVTFSVAGRGGVPLNASAVTGNVTVANSSAGWAVYLGPAAIVSPTTSTINFNTAEVKGNSLTVALSGSGGLSATYIGNTGNTTDLVFDVTGYYTPDGTGSRFVAITPARLLDTRLGNGWTGRIFANSPATFGVRGRGGVPTDATGVTGNVTVVNQTSSWAVFLGPDPTPAPTTSTINFNKGDVKGNGLTVALSSGGNLSATYISNSGNTTDLVFDATGYFVP
jgi:hypothetical protein